MFRLSIIITSFTIISFFLNGCYYDVEEELYPDSFICNIDSVSYNIEVLPIIQFQCYQCHNAASNFGNVNLEGHSNINVYADNGKLMGAINHESGFSPMPKNQSQLGVCDLETINKWILDGAPNN